MSESMRNGVLMFGKGFLLALLVGGYGMASSADYEQEIADQALYCQMVTDGAWPDSPDHHCLRDDQHPSDQVARI